MLKFVDTFWGIDEILNIVLGYTVTCFFMRRGGGMSIDAGAQPK